jgi:hypothetical protein
MMRESKDERARRRQTNLTKAALQRAEQMMRLAQEVLST